MPADHRHGRIREQTPWATVGQPRLVHALNLIVFWIVLAVLAFAPLAGGAAELWAQGPIMGALALAGVLWAISLCIGRETHVIFSTMSAPVLVLMTYGIVRYSMADVESLARPHLLAITSSALLFFLTLNSFRQRWQVLALAWTVIGIACAMALFGFSQVLLDGSTRERVATGLFDSTAAYAVYLHVGFATAGAFFLFSRCSVNEKIVFAFAGIAMVIGLAFSRSYWHWGGWFAGTCVLGVYLLRRRGWRFRWVLVGTITLLLVVGAALAVITHVERTAIHSDAFPSAKANDPAWFASIRQALQIGRVNLITGASPGKTALLTDQPAASPGLGTVGNEYASALADYGVVGAALLAWTIICFGVLAFRILALRAERYSASTASNRYAFAVAGLAAFVAAIVDAGVGGGLRDGANLLTLTAVMATTLTCGLHQHGDPEVRPPKLGQYTIMRMKSIPRYVLIGGVCALVGLLLSRLYYTYPAYLLTKLGDRKRSHLQWTQAHVFYTRAWQLDQRNCEIAEALADLNAVRATWNIAQREQFSIEAVRWYDRTLTLNPYDADAFVKKGRILELLGRHEKAAECFQQAVHLRPRRAAYHAELARHYERRHDTEAAQPHQQRANELAGTR